MRFIVSRTSVRDGRPCDGAVLETLEIVDKRVAPAHRLPGGEAKFLEYGRDHKLLKTKCSRVVDWEVWTIDADIIAFVEEHGECVVTPPGCGWLRTVEPLWKVEIYDGYRE